MKIFGVLFHELNNAVNRGVQSIILTAANIGTRMDFGTALANNNLTGAGLLTIADFGA
jgi:hypothetical protein